MRSVALSAVKAGMTRLLDKGGASPESLWLLRNGYVNASRRATQRPGTMLETDTLAGTKGLCAFRGGFVVFSHQVTPMADPRFTCEVLIHPNGAEVPIKEIHFAEPFLGYLYVVAEFEDGVVQHYWLESVDAWEPEKAYDPNGRVQPTDPNGFIYHAHRLTEPGRLWEPNVERQVGDVVEPTVFNGYEYVAVEVHGNPARSGEVEPDWPARPGAVVVEEADTQATPPPPQSPPPPPGPPPRYDNPGGSTPPKGDIGGGNYYEQVR